MKSVNKKISEQLMEASRRLEEQQRTAGRGEQGGKRS
jgi:hypothetical protein